MRKHLVEDFTSIYILDLDGDAGEAVEVSDASVFGIQIGEYQPVCQDKAESTVTH